MAAATIDAASHTGASLMYQGGRIRVRGHRGEGTLAARIRHRHIGPTPGIILWTAIGYMCRSYLVRIDSTLNTERYVSEVLYPMTLPFVRARERELCETLRLSRRLDRHHTPGFTVDELWYRLEAAWSFVPYMPSNLCLT
ncbi:hypothetical protein TNCV_5120961 [Trichonephila clavipes]|nr:hypothetical protein TNCV_5120961 [Trichonephila clavipes]